MNIWLVLGPLIGSSLFWVPWLVTKMARPYKPAPKEILDPIAAEARRLAEEEVAEMDWRFGTGEKPKHIVKQEEQKRSRELTEAVRKRDAEYAAKMHGGAMKEAEKASAKLAAYYREKYGESVPVETESEVVKELYEEAIRRIGAVRTADGTEHVIKNGLGQVVMRYLEPGPVEVGNVVVDEKGEVVGMTCPPLQRPVYPRPRHGRRPHPGTRSGGPG